MRKGEQVVSFLGVVVLALALPLLLKGLNGITKLLVGAEGRLAMITVETDHPLGPMPRPWQALAQGGEELQTFLDNTSSQVSALRPNFIRIDHIYDGFNVVSRSGSGLNFDWTGLDAAVNKIRSVGATPFLSLSYMPLAISKSDVTDVPNDWNDWAVVVQKTIEHYSGEKAIPGVYYEVWNEPDLFGKWTMGGKKDYKTLYLYAARGAANARGAQSFKLGGPATTGLYKNWIDQFFPFILDNKLRLDFFSWHRYDLNLEQYTQDVDSVQKWIEGQPYFSNVEKIVSEMGPSSDKSPLNDSRIAAAHIIATANELLYKVKLGFNFSIKDASNSEGGWGLIGPNGQPKSRYWALSFLSRLGNQRLATTGEGSWVRSMAAQNGDTFQVLLVNYDPRNTHSEVVPVNFIDLKGENFTIKQSVLGANTVSRDTATDAGVLQFSVPMTPNSVVLLELTPKSQEPNPKSL